MGAKKERLKRKKQRKKPRRTFLARIKGYIITTILGGIVVILPITLSYIAIRFLWNQAQNFTGPVKQLINVSTDDSWAAWVVDLTALGVMLSAFFLLGLFVETNFGKEFWNNLDKHLLSKLPLYTVLRDTVRQFLGNTDKMPFSEVVEVDVYNNGTRMIGFVSDRLKDGRYSIFVPTGPNPTNGFIFLVEPQQVEFSKVKPEEAMRIVVGVGTGAGELFKKSKKPVSP